MTISLEKKFPQPCINLLKCIFVIISLLMSHGYYWSNQHIAQSYRRMGSTESFNFFSKIKIFLFYILLRPLKTSPFPAEIPLTLVFDKWESYGGRIFPCFLHHTIRLCLINGRSSQNLGVGSYSKLFFHSNFLAISNFWVHGILW